MRWMAVPVVVLAAAGSVWAAAAVSAWWLIGVVVFGLLVLLAIADLVQTRHAVLRNYPLIGHFRYLLETVRPEIQQYFIERDYDGRPFDRDVRSAVYEQAKGIHEETSFGTELDVTQIGYEFVEHSTAPREP